MADDTREPMEGFEGWFLRRVGQAVEAGEVSVDLLTDLQGEFETARDKSQEEAHATAVRDIAETLEMPLEQTEQGLRAIEAQPAVTREVLMRRIAEVWLEGHRKVYRQCDRHE